MALKGCGLMGLWIVIDFVSAHLRCTMLRLSWYSLMLGPECIVIIRSARIYLSNMLGLLSYNMQHSLRRCLTCSDGDAFYFA